MLLLAHALVGLGTKGLLLDGEMGGEMKVVFISGPYRGKTEFDVKCNIETAERVALKYWRLGYAVICPHKNTAFFGGACPDHFWLDGDMEFLRRCDIIIMLPNWEMSEGAKKEFDVATKSGLDVIFEK